MSSLEILSQPIWQRLCLVLLHFLWQGLAVAVLLAATVALFRIRKAPTRYALSLAALLVLIACPVITYFIVETPVTPSELTRAEAMLPRFDRLEALPLERFEASGDVAVALEREEPESIGSESLQSGLLSAVQPYAAVVWLAGVVALSVRLLLSLLGIQWLKAGRRPVDSALANKIARLS